MDLHHHLREDIPLNTSLLGIEYIPEIGNLAIIGDVQAEMVNTINGEDFETSFGNIVRLSFPGSLDAFLQGTHLAGFLNADRYSRIHVRTEVSMNLFDHDDEGNNITDNIRMLDNNMPYSIGRIIVALYNRFLNPDIRNSGVDHINSLALDTQYFYFRYRFFIEPHGNEFNEFQNLLYPEEPANMVYEDPVPVAVPPPPAVQPLAPPVLQNRYVRERANINPNNIVPGRTRRQNMVVPAVGNVQNFIQPLAIQNVGHGYNTRHNPNRMNNVFIGAKEFPETPDVLNTKMYTRKTLGDFFAYTKAVICVPESEDLLCFPMAFMRSQLRVWNIKRFNQVGVPELSINITEGLILKLPFHKEDLSDLPVYLKPNKYVFFDMDDNGAKINLFDNSKKPLKRKTADKDSIGMTVYKNELRDLEPEELQAWAWCATQIHMYVETVLGESVNKNNLDACLRAYSCVFKINIHVFLLEAEGNRIAIQRYNEEILATTLQYDESHIALLLHGSHLHAIGSIRDYLSTYVSRRYCIGDYCDHCATLCANRGDKKSKFAHHCECMKNNNWEIQNFNTEESTQDTYFRCMTEDKRTHSVYSKEEKDRYGMLCRNCKKIEWECKCIGETIKESVSIIMCTVCKQKVARNHYNCHDCYMPTKKVLDPIPNEKIYVFDLEAEQDYDESSGQFIHMANLFVIMSVYNEDIVYHFKSIEEAIQFIIVTPEFKDSVFLAHNGGGYDAQFIIRYLEDNCISHTSIPRPNTIHKYLAVKLNLIILSIG